MSQIENAGTSSSKTKRVNRKRQPLSGQRNRKCLFPVKETHKAINVFIDKQLKDDLVQLCETTGLTQTQMIERWIQSEKARVFNP
ncbi:replication regulatory protein RepA (plasmid) [Klebsiella pneumoniae]|uniref:replication regulatory protein RepA n=1 Tax=Klebsiella pneumoniae TaxID=573 RepID=UPI0021F73956|nr:replication regulatory protein RepA [Klebsiella pneumoniae]UYS33248.1 replication regulatory protein RepA [Klebsiella pneumoniae]UYS33389.1 replication regulatory protein RepA [Klebsiella pneumoniae]